MSAKKDPRIDAYIAKAMGAVLLIEFSGDDRMAVNAEHIVMITEGTRTS